VAGGVYDLNTPYFGSFYGVSHVGLHPSLHKNIQLRRYPGGHQMYLDLQGLADLRRDSGAFVADVLEPTRSEEPDEGHAAPGASYHNR